MGNKKKFEKLERNEAYYAAHADEEQNEKKESIFNKIKEKKEKKHFFDIDAKNVPEKEKLSSTFTYTKEKRKQIYTQDEVIEVENPSKAPLVLLLIVVFLVLVSGVFTSSEIYSSLSAKNAAIVKTVLMTVSYVVPAVVYILSSSSRRGFYNIRRFPTSMMSVSLAGLGLVTCVSLLQKYFITYVFSYNVPVGVTSQNLLLAIAVGALVPAICEELLVRGVLQYEFSKYAGGVSGVIICSLVFGVLHFDLQYFPVYFVAGLVLGGLTHITHSVFPAMLVHFLNNTISILFSDKLSYIALRHIGGTLFMIILASLSFLFLILFLRQAENISSKRAATLVSKEEAEENTEEQPSWMFFSVYGKSFTRFVKLLCSPYVIVTVMVFVIAVTLKFAL